MKHYSNYLFVVVLASGLALTSLNAIAKTSNLDSSPVFNTKSYTSFNGNIDIGSNFFFTPFKSSTDNKSSFGIGLDVRNQYDFAIPHSDTTEGDSQQWNTVIREIGNGGETNFHHDFETYFHHDDFRYTASPVPEPAEYLFLASGFALLYFVVIRRRLSINF